MGTVEAEPPRWRPKKRQQQGQHDVRRRRRAERRRQVRGALRERRAHARAHVARERVDGRREAVERGELPTHRGHRRSEDDDRRRRIILDLMCRFRLDYADHGGPTEFTARYADALERLRPMADDGLVQISEHGLRVLDAGKLLIRNLAMAFDAYLPNQQQQGDGPKFSRTV